MKKVKLITAIIIISLNGHAQGFAGLFATNNGVGIQAGFLASKIDVNASLKFPLADLTSPTIYSLSIGRQLLITQKEADNYSITPSIGIAYTQVKDFTAYDQNPYIAPTNVNEVHTIYSLEAGKDAYLGRVYVQANYCKIFYVNVGMRIFFNR